MKKALSVSSILFLNIFLSVFIISIFAQSKEIMNAETRKGTLIKEPILEAKLKKSIFNKQEAVLLSVTLKNASSETITLSDSRAERLFDVTVKNINDVDFDLKKEAKKRKTPDIIMGREIISLKPMEETSWQINLNELYDITSPASYIVDVKLPKYYHLISSQKADFTSTNFVITNAVEFKLVE